MAGDMCLPSRYCRSLLQHKSVDLSDASVDTEPERTSQDMCGTSYTGSRRTFRRNELRRRATARIAATWVHFFGNLVSYGARAHTKFGVALAAFLPASRSMGRGRPRPPALLPTPPMGLVDLHFMACVPKAVYGQLLDLTNITLCSLNHMYSKPKSLQSHARPTATQRSMGQHILNRWWKTAQLASRGGSPSSHVGAVRALMTKSLASVPLTANRVDGLITSGCVDPLSSIPAEERVLLHDPSRLFTASLNQLPSSSMFTCGHRAEYVCLVRRQIRSAKIELRCDVDHAAAIMMRAKQGKDRQREIWCGGELSAATVPAPAPPLLANPTALGGLEASQEARIWLSSRDGLVQFDQLSFPVPLRRFRGKPWVRLDELCNPFIVTDGSLDDMLPLTWEEATEAVVDRDSCMLTGRSVVAPCSRVWPMGFRWSAYIAQSDLVRSLSDAGWQKTQFITTEALLPEDPSTPMVAAIDDVNSFTRCTYHDKCEVVEGPLNTLDTVWRERGIQANTSKSVDCVSQGTVLGLELGCGIEFRPKQGRVAELVSLVLEFYENRYASPKAMQCLLGKLQWILLLVRPSLSALHRVYDFTSLEPADKVRWLPGEVLDELVLCSFLLPCVYADLTRPWLSQLLASDASDSYGFGVVAAACSQELVRKAAVHCSKPSHYVRLRVAEGEQCAHVPREGVFLELPLAKSDFKVLVRRPAKIAAHSSALEAGAAVLAIEHLARRKRNFHARALLLLDATALLFCVRKGRSSAGNLMFQQRRLAALCLGMNLKLSVGYVPSESNPADDPSRGRGSKLAKLRRKVGSDKSARMLEKVYRAHKKRCRTALSYGRSKVHVDGKDYTTSSTFSRLVQYG